MMSALKVLALVATLVAGVYAVIQYHLPQTSSAPSQSGAPTGQHGAQSGSDATFKPGAPPHGKASETSRREGGSNVPTSGVLIGGNVEQKSTGNNSPNVISGGNVTIGK